MKYLCLVYQEETKLDALSKSEYDAVVSEVLDYREELRQSRRPCNPFRWPRPYGFETARYPSPTAPSPRQRSNWVVFT